MNGRRRLTWVTAVTVASLLLGGGALNALAEGHGGGNGDHGVGQGKSEHQQQQKPAVVNQASHEGESHAQNTEQASHADQDTNVQKHQDDDTTVQRVDDDNEDLVTPPVRVTGEDRPGLGCGDDNHTHTGAPGNPGLTCKSDADDHGVTTDDADATVSVAGATAVGDDSDGN